MGHEERFPPTRLSAGYGFRKETIAGVRHNERDAPISAIFRPPIEPRPLSGCHAKCEYEQETAWSTAIAAPPARQVRLRGRRWEFRDGPQTP